MTELQKLLELAEKAKTLKGFYATFEVMPEHMIPILTNAIRNEALLKESVEMAEFYREHSNHSSKADEFLKKVNNDK